MRTEHTKGGGVQGARTPQPNIAVEPTRNSLRCYVAAALARGSPRAFGANDAAVKGLPRHY
jgi:hypothetical protein